MFRLCEPPKSPSCAKQGVYWLLLRSPSTDHFRNRSYHIETKRFIEIHCSSKPNPMKISGLVENRRICSSCGDCDLGRLGGRWTVRRVLRIRRRNYRWRCLNGGCGVGEGRTNERSLISNVASCAAHELTSP